MRAGDMGKEEEALLRNRVQATARQVASPRAELKASHNSNPHF